MRELAMESDPSHSVTQSVRPIEDYHELRDKGGPLGKINVRVFFYLDKRELRNGNRHAIVVLGVIKKEADGPTPIGDKIRMRNRLRRYLNGEFGELRA